MNYVYSNCELSPITGL